MDDQMFGWAVVDCNAISSFLSRGKLPVNYVMIIDHKYDSFIDSMSPLSFRGAIIYIHPLGR